jgi:hypothetical protein
MVSKGDDITGAKLKDMNQKKIIAYVPEKIKNQNEAFKKSSVVRNLNELPEDLKRYVLKQQLTG